MSTTIRIGDRDVIFKPLKLTAKTIKYLAPLLLGEKNKNQTEGMVALVDAINTSLRMTYSEQETDEILDLIDFKEKENEQLISALTQAIFPNQN
jgi:hypothetical protein